MRRVPNNVVHVREKELPDINELDFASYRNRVVTRELQESETKARNLREEKEITYSWK